MKISLADEFAKSQARLKNVYEDNSTLNRIQDSLHFGANSSYKNSRVAASAMATSSYIVAGAGLGGAIGGLGGAMSDDSSFGSGLAKGAAFGALGGAAAGGAAIGYGRHLGKQGYTYKTSMYSAAGIPQGHQMAAGAIHNL